MSAPELSSSSSFTFMSEDIIAQLAKQLWQMKQILQHLTSTSSIAPPIAILATYDTT